MPTELEELVEFLHHENPTIRHIAADNMVGYSLAQPSVFKSNALEPIRDLKALIKEPPAVAKNALTMLINLSAEPMVLQNLALDDEFIKYVLTSVTNPTNSNATETCELIANLSKHPSFQKVLKLQLPSRGSLKLSKSNNAIDQLLSVFLLGESGQYNTTCTFDYLAYAFAELAKFAEARKHFTTPKDEDEGQVPLSKVAVFTEHKSSVRRRGVAHTIKNVCFEVDVHPKLLSPELNENNILPYILLPLMGSETFPDDEMDEMPEELQLLPPDKERENDLDILKTHLDSLLLLSTEKASREILRKKQVYPIVRECHAAVHNDDVQDACDRVVQILMRDEAKEGQENTDTQEKLKEIQKDDEDFEILEV